MHLYFCPFDITRKDVFCMAFYFKLKYFLLIDNILSETICLFYFCVLFSNIYLKIKFIAKNIGLACAISIVKIIFGYFIKENIFLLFFAGF